MAEGMTEKKKFCRLRFRVRALAAPVARLRGVFGEIDRGPLAYSRRRWRPFSTFNRLARPSPTPPPRPSPTSIADAAATRTPRKRDTPPPPTLVLRSPRQLPPQRHATTTHPLPGSVPRVLAAAGSAATRPPGAPTPPPLRHHTAMIAPPGTMRQVKTVFDHGR